MTGRKRGRPATSGHVRVTPEFRKEPDIEKLGRVLIAVAISIAEKNKAGKPEEAAVKPEDSGHTSVQVYSVDRKGDGMT